MSAQRSQLIARLDLPDRGDRTARAHGRRTGKAIEEELDRIPPIRPTPSEIEQARNTIETNIIGGLERLGGFGGVADRLNSYNHYSATPDYLAKDIERYRAVTPAIAASVRERSTPHRTARRRACRAR